MLIVHHSTAVADSDSDCYFPSLSSESESRALPAGSSAAVLAHCRRRPAAERCLSESRPVKMLSSIVKCLLCLLPCGFASFIQLLNNTASILTVAVENPTAQTAGAWTEEVSMDLRFLKISGTVSVSCGLPDSCGEMIFSLAIQVILFSTARCAPQQHFSKFNAANASSFTT
jgi:hypothetical protein